MDRKKGLSINIIAIMVILFAFMAYYFMEFLNYNFTIKKHYSEIEKIQSTMQLETFDKIMKSKIESQETVLLDYAIWTDTYENIDNPEWMSKEIVDWIGDYYSQSNVIVTDNNHKLLYSYSEAPTQFQSKITNLISTSNNKSGSGYIQHDNIISIVSFSEVRPNEGDNYDKIAYLIISLDINDHFISEFSDVFGYNLSLEYGDKENFEVDASKMISRYPLMDSNKNEIGHFTITTKRDIYQTLMMYEYNYRIIQLLLLLITLFITYIVVRKFITKPFKILEKDIMNLDTNKYNYLEEKYNTLEINNLVRRFNSLIYKLLYVETQNEKLISANKMDFLTKLYNRNHLNHYLNTSKEKNLSFIFIDIDNFKSINDYHGHEKGDIILKEIGKVIKLNNQGKYKGFRYGGEELVIVYKDTKDVAYNIAENLRKIIIKHPTIQKYSIDKPITISCGIASYPEDTNSLESAVNLADIAMYNAKKNGKNRTHLYTNHDNQENGVFEMEFNLDYIIAVSNAIDSKIPFKENHAKFVADYSYLVGKKLGFTDKALKELRIAAYIHDIGKISIPDSIFLKKTSLNPKEKEIVTKHPIHGYEIISKATNSEIILRSIKEHHERIDGNGFPDGLKADEISIYARIIAVVNSYHTMISDLPYNKAMSHKEAKEELINNKGTQFDSAIVDIFLGLMD